MKKSEITMYMRRVQAGRRKLDGFLAANPKPRTLNEAALICLFEALWNCTIRLAQAAYSRAD